MKEELREIIEENELIIQVSELKRKNKELMKRNIELKKKQGIVLQNINLDGYTLIQQMEKVREEDDEFLTAIIRGDRDNAIEEYWDKMQSGLGALKMMGIDEEEVMAGNKKHKEKMKNRDYKPRVKEMK